MNRKQNREESVGHHSLINRFFIQNYIALHSERLMVIHHYFDFGQVQRQQLLLLPVKCQLRTSRDSFLVIILPFNRSTLSVRSLQTGLPVTWASNPFSDFILINRHRMLIIITATSFSAKGGLIKSVTMRSVRFT